MNEKYKDNLDEAAILNELDFLFQMFKAERKRGESFGDFSNRKWGAAATMAN